MARADTTRISKIKVDEKFRALVFRPNDEQYAALKAGIARDGIEEPLTVDQNGILLDGYTRFQIATELGLPKVPVKVHPFADRQEAVRFILRMAVQRRNLNKAQLADLALRLLDFETDEAKRRQASGGKAYHRGKRKVSQPVGEPFDGKDRGDRALDRAAEPLGVSGEIVRQYREIKKHEEEFPELKERRQQALADHDKVGAIHKKLRILVKEKEAREDDQEPVSHTPGGGEQKLLGSREPTKDSILFGDCLKVLPTIASHSIDLIVTSPPYADNRKSTYEGHRPEEYVEWFLPIADELARVLKPDGSFILNIKERVVNGERGAYVHDLIRGMRQRGWRWVEEYVWVKKNTTPGYWPTRFQDRWEPCHHFTRSDKFRMYQSQVKEPIGAWAEKRLAKLSEADLTRLESATRSGSARNMSRWVGKGTVNPSNIIVLATESSNKGHSAAFPERLPAWFIRLFTRKGDTVLDPFAGSGTTPVAAVKLGRHYLGIEKYRPYHKLAKQRITEAIEEYAKHGTPRDYMLPVSKVNGERHP